MFEQQIISEILEKGIRSINFKKDPQGLYNPIEYTFEAGGKHIRPRLCLTSFNLFSDNISQETVYVAMALEIFHQFTLLHDDIMERPHGYQHKLIEGGRDFSGGQRQRMEIARVLAQDPTIIILDEATSALDSKTEYDVVRAIRDRGITCIVIAHRLSTIRSCDEIILMDNGKIAARGTHKELMETSEQYRTLVTSE